MVLVVGCHTDNTEVTWISISCPAWQSLGVQRPPRRFAISSPSFWVENRVHVSPAEETVCMFNIAGFPSAHCEGRTSVLPTLHPSCQCWDPWPLSFRVIWQFLSCCSPLISPTNLTVCLVQSVTRLFFHRRPGDCCNDPYHYYRCLYMCVRETNIDAHVPLCTRGDQRVTSRGSFFSSLVKQVSCFCRMLQIS